MTTTATPGGASHFADAGSVTDMHTRRSEKLLLYSVCFFRLAGLLQIAITLAVEASRNLSLGPIATLAMVVTAESLLLIAGCLRRGRLVSAWITADVVFCTAAMIINAHLSLAKDLSWARSLMFGFTVVVSSVAIALTYQWLFTVLAMTSVVAASWALTEWLLHDEINPPITYFAAALPSWAVARAWRRSAQDADASHKRALAQASELAVERERTHYARMLHDRVLQTLETLSNGNWIADADLRTHIAAEAGWLRAVIQGMPVNQPHDLHAVLQSVVQEKARSGLRVEFNEAGLRAADQLRGQLSPATVDAVAGAVREALTNVTKHAAVDTVVVRATLTADQLIVSVLDHGIGFDPSSIATNPCPSVGLAQSVRARINEIGGTARIDSAPGAGTHIELSIPVQSHNQSGKKC